MTLEKRHPTQKFGLEKTDLRPKEVKHAARHWGITAKQIVCQFG